MPFKKLPPALLIFAAVALCIAAAFFVASCDKGSINSTNTVPLATITPVANCVVNDENDVIVGGAGTDAKPGCDNVEMKPSASDPDAYDEIKIEAGGTLTITPDDEEASSAAGVTPHASIPIATLETPMRSICIEDGGKLQYGTKAKPITSRNKVVLEFLGTRDSKKPDQCIGFQKGIEVMAGGSLLMYGAKGVPARGGVSWTTLAAPAGSQIPGAKVKSAGLKTLKLTADVTKGTEGWQPGDWIVIGTTSFNPFDSEFVQIDTVSKDSKSGGSVITLMQPLKHYHFGSPSPSTGTSAACPDRLGNPGPASYCDGAEKNYGVDERAEVGLISRDIELTVATEPVTTVPPPATSSAHWGGEIMIHPGFKEVSIQGVRLSKFGKDQLGSYPIHFHMVGDIGTNQTALIDADSVDHSYNKCVTIHNTSNLTISNLVCARIVGHIFYEELDNTSTTEDSGITFQDDLGLGAMSNSFDINPLTLTDGTKMTRQQLINQYWWTGDYMTNDPKSFNYIGYDGFNIPDTDDWNQPTHGSCASYQPSGILGGFGPPNAGGQTACDAPQIYIEPATGFWIQNPATNLIGNAIGGCQGVGNGFWWVPPLIPITVNDKMVALQYQALGTVKDNRAHACYNGFFDDNSIGFITSGQLFPHMDTNQAGASASIIATFDGLTATRNRFRGLWMRPTWIVVKNGRFSANRENVSLLTSGGIDGNAPGVWNLLEDSVLVGLSENNVERWGPCPATIFLEPSAAPIGGIYGCIDYTPSQLPHSGEIFDNGYQEPFWNSEGYMLYDGPARVFHDRFVNFNYDDPVPDYSSTATDCSTRPTTGCQFSNGLDDADLGFLITYSNPAQSQTPTGQKPFVYEGDAAFGWFQSNQNSYPTGTATRQLSFVNTNLRHQVYTAPVSLNTTFNDGDKNTSILDEDGTLSGLGVQLAPGAGTHPVHPISLNNLPFNDTSNSVDECISRGAQNEKFEDRTSALMSPASMGTLQFSSLYPYDGGDYPSTNPNGHWQQATFTRDDSVPTPPPSTAMFHPTMVMRTGRNGLGSFEPKVSNGYGYTVAVAPTTVAGTPPQSAGQSGLWKWIDVTLADIVDPNISQAHPFYVQIGICYSSKSGPPHPRDPGHPANGAVFTIERGYKSYVGGNVWQQNPQLLQSWTPLDCNNLDSQNTANVPSSSNAYKGTCPSGPVTALSSATNIGALTNTDGTPSLDKYYYNPATGMLYLNIVQNEANPLAPSPTGSCDSAYDGGKPDPACPDIAQRETYFACPKNGCTDYTIAINAPAAASYVPGASTCTPDPKNLKPAPAEQNKLVLYGTKTVITRKMETDKQGVPYYEATNGPVCKATQP